jgi:hypothetical protein
MPAFPATLALAVMAALWVIVRNGRRPAAAQARRGADFALARTLARRGASSETLVREARIAHDVATLACFVGGTSGRKKLPPAASSAARRRRGAR